MINRTFFEIIEKEGASKKENLLFCSVEREVSRVHHVYPVRPLVPQQKTRFAILSRNTQAHLGRGRRNQQPLKIATWMKQSI